MLLSMGEPITVPLRLAVSKIVASISYNVMGLDVHREGNLLFNAAHTYSYEVAAACCGLQKLDWRFSPSRPSTDFYIFKRAGSLIFNHRAGAAAGDVKQRDPFDVHHPRR